MTRKHNVKHRRSPSNYKRRLEDRGLRYSPRMPELHVLRRKQRHTQEHTEQ